MSSSVAGSVCAVLCCAVTAWLALHAPRWKLPVRIHSPIDKSMVKLPELMCTCMHAQLEHKHLACKPLRCGPCQVSHAELLSKPKRIGCLVMIETAKLALVGLLP